jgi:hypothetical protein
VERQKPTHFVSIIVVGMDPFVRPTPDNELCSGAGMLPYTVHEGKLLFLFHRTFIGKKHGTLNDFGGAVDEADASDPIRAASREFIEETFACPFEHHSLEELKLMAAGLETESAMQHSGFVQQHIEDFYLRFKTQYYSTVARTSHIAQQGDKESWPLALRSEACGLWNGSFDRYFLFFCFLQWKPALEMTELFQFLSSTSKPESRKGESSIKMRSFEWVASDHILQERPDPPLFSRVANIHNLRGYICRLLDASPLVDQVQPHL